MWNPLRTLAGRLLLVTIAAIMISHAVAFTLFANERGRTLRRVAETTLAERVAYTADRLRGAQAPERAALVGQIRDFSIRYRYTSAPSVERSSGQVAPRVARLVSQSLDGSDVRASERIVAQRPPNWRGAPPPYRDRLDAAERDAVRQRIAERMGDARSFERGPRPRATEVTLSISLGQNSWLEARALLPAPRPLPLDIIAAALASIVFVGAGAMLVSRQISKPLAGLARAARQFGEGETGVKAPATGPDDVKRASDAFNTMAERLGRQISRQRHMLWALGHDLKTPITAMRLRAELLEDDSAKQKLLQSIAEMETLTEQALSLARAGASEEAMQRIDLSEIVRTLCGELSDIGVNIRAEAETPVFARCRPDEIARALRNLAENADRYGRGGIMRATRSDGIAILEVLDDGPGLPPDDLARVTTPFFRADPSRSGEGGAGLGLAIAQAIADSHGGKLIVENRPPHGLRAAITLTAA